MNFEGLLDQFRYQVGDREVPYLWEDDELFPYFVEAQDQFVRAIGGIRDSTSALTSIAFNANDVFVAHSPWILKIRAAKLASDNRTLDLVDISDADALRVSDYGNQYSSMFDDTDTGEVHALVLGLEENKLRLVKVPAAAGTIKLVQILRLPYPRPDSWDDTPEIAEEHHLELIEWVKHRAYMKNDAEVRDKRASDEALAKFLSLARDAEMKLRRKAGKVPVVRYRDW